MPHYGFPKIQRRRRHIGKALELLNVFGQNLPKLSAQPHQTSLRVVVTKVLEPRGTDDKRLDLEFRTTVVQAANNRVHVAMSMSAFEHHFPGVTDEMARVIGNSHRFRRLYVQYDIMLYPGCFVYFRTISKPLCAAENTNVLMCVDRLKKSRRTVRFAAVQQGGYEHVTIVGLVKGSDDAPRVIHDPFTGFRRNGGQTKPFIHKTSVDVVERILAP